MSQAKLREALAGGAPTKEKGPPVADGVISETPDTPEAIEWRTKQSVIDSITSSSTYLDPEIESSPPSSVYGKFTWHIENFSDTSKRELRSGVFQVGPYRWYVLVYPQGCDVSNHLSLFLCVADYDKLLPGWGHYAQFTIAVVNKDPKKSKYSDTLHRFCKKEHDWGWKKFMELNKVSDGFTVNDTLVIKAQVQVIPDRPVRPFRTLESQYRRELVRVYLTNVEGIVRRYVDEKRAVLSRVLSGEGFIQFWQEQSDERRKKLASAPAAPLLKNLVKKFFNEKEVTSTLVMDALYCGAKLLERAGHIAVTGNGNNTSSSSSRAKAAAAAAAAAAAENAAAENAAAAAANADAPEFKKAKDAKETAADTLTIASTSDPSSLLPGLVINTSTDRMFFAGDLIAALRRMVSDPVPTFNPDTKPTSDALALRNAQDVDDQSKGSVERDERRLADLGRRTVEMFGAAHIVEAQLEAAWAEAETIKRQEELIREVEEASRGEAVRAAAKAETEKERKARKKERQRAKKEAEKAKKDAEEAERQRQEEDRKAQAEKQRQEAEEKRRKDEAEKAENEARTRHAAELKRQADLAAKAAAKAAKETAKKAATNCTKEQQTSSATSAVPAPTFTIAAAAAAAAAGTSRVGSQHSSSSSNGNSPSSSATDDVISPDICCPPALRDAVAVSSSSDRVAGAGGLGDLSSTPSRAVSAGASIPTQGPVGANNDLQNATTTTHGLVDALRAEIRRLTLIVNGKDEEISGLRNRVAELESHFVTSRPGSSLSQQAQASPEVSSSSAEVPGGKRGGVAVVPAGSTINNTHMVYSGSSNGTNNISNGGGSNPSDAILATASMMPQHKAPPPGMVVGPSGANGRPMSANAQFAPVPPNGSGGGGTMGPYIKIRANGNGGPNGSSHSSGEGMPPPPQHANAVAATGAAGGMMPPNGVRAYQSGNTQAPARGTRAFSSPLPNSKRGVGDASSGLAPGLESPGLDDFAHIGLINDLLE
ncbi:hypothetical protein Ndes2526B_g08521 [Nannochloris sp. 'desiccata']|nr:hypothetical protein KSW81_001883 [Chlorella desiccata (nom. nud.)]KAH7616428.1 putative TNF receptor-associated factor-like protein 1a [Chlorella desiccata (nom. nud.)]